MSMIIVMRAKEVIKENDKDGYLFYFLKKYAQKCL